MYLKCFADLKVVDNVLGKTGAEHSRGYGTTNVGYGTTNADAGVGIGLKGGFRNLTKKAIN